MQKEEEEPWRSWLRIFEISSESGGVPYRSAIVENQEDEQAVLLAS